MKKRITLLLTVLLLICLTSCGPDDPTWRTLGAGADPDTETHAMEEEDAEEELEMYADNWMLESSPGGYDSPEGLLADLAEYTDLEEVWWVDEEQVVDWLDAVRDSRSKLKLTALQGTMTPRSLKGLLQFHLEGYIGLYPLAEFTQEFAETARSFTLFVSALPVEEPLTPRDWRPSTPSPVEERMVPAAANWESQPDEEGPGPYSEEPVEETMPEFTALEDHPGFEMAVSVGDQNAPLQVRLRWWQDGYMFLAEIPYFSLDAFWDHWDQLFIKQDLNQYREVSSSEESSEEPASEGYDPVVSSPCYSGQEAMLEDFRRFGQNLPEEIFWIDEEAVRGAFGADGYLSATCQDGLLHFDTYYKDMDSADLAERYGVSQEDWESREMKSWPWYPWRLVGTRFNFFATVRPEEEPPEPESWKPREPVVSYREQWEWGGSAQDDTPHELLAGPLDEEGNLLPTPSPTPVPADREPLADYQPPEWVPAEGHEGYELAVVASTDAGVPLCVRVRWQREGCWFLAEIPGHALEAFWEQADGFFIKVDMSNAGYDIPTLEAIYAEGEAASVEGSEAE